MLSQWRGYASDGQGISIGFSKEYLKQGEPASEHSGWLLRKVNYGDGDPSAIENLTHVVENLKMSAQNRVWDDPGLLEYSQNNDITSERLKQRSSSGFGMLMLMFDAIVLKNPAFREEQEWRLICHTLRGAEGKRSYRPLNDRIVPYREFKIREGDVPAILEVTLGPKNISHIKDIKDFLAANGFVDVKVSRSNATYR